MAVSTHIEIGWRDIHTVYMSHLYTLYKQNIMTTTPQLCDIGYTAYPDPIYTQGSAEHKPDFIAFSESYGDVQHISVCDFDGVDPDQIEIEVEKKLTAISDFNQITDQMVSEYLDLRNIDFSPSLHELVALIPAGIYDSHSTIIDEIANDENLIIWVIETNGSASIWKTFGGHQNLDLDTEIESTYQSYRNGTDLLRYTRGSNEDRLKFEFTQRLVKHCAREGDRGFHINDVDAVMVENEPPVLGHLTPEERERYWRRCMHSLINRFEMVDSTGRGNYEWTKKQFVKETRYRQQILDKMKMKLGLEQ